MARARNIKPSFYADEDLAESIGIRFVFAGLWMQADREGRFEHRPKGDAVARSHVGSSDRSDLRVSCITFNPLKRMKLLGSIEVEYA